MDWLLSRQSSADGGIEAAKGLESSTLWRERPMTPSELAAKKPIAWTGKIPEDCLSSECNLAAVPSPLTSRRKSNRSGP